MCPCILRGQSDGDVRTVAARFAVDVSPGADSAAAREGRVAAAEAIVRRLASGGDVPCWPCVSAVDRHATDTPHGTFNRIYGLVECTLSAARK